ncbi:MAG: hypothetical protein ACFFCF_06100 [Promethearchaeota archaeon]
MQSTSEYHRHPNSKLPVEEFLVQGVRTRQGALRAHLLHTTRLLTEKGAIDAKPLRQYTKRHIDRRIRLAVAFRRALRQMRDEGKIDREKILPAVDGLIAEKKLPPRVRQSFTLLLH